MQGMHAILLLITAAAQAGQAPVPPFSVGLLRAREGETVSGMLEIPAASDPGAQVPVTILRGTRPGPVLALVAGVHGYEYPPILALQKLRSQLDPQRLSGTLLLVHVANLPSFLGRTVYFSPIDHKNLNRVFPGKPDGTTSQRIAHAITTQVIDRCDYLVDLHCGDGNESLRPYLYLPVTGQARLDAVMREMALVWGLDHIVIERDRPRDPAASIYCSTTAVTRGKPALIVEDGYLGSSDPESIDRLVRGARSLMRHLKMLEGTPQRVSHPVFLDPAQVLTSPATGILYPRVQRGHYVAKGALLATITDFFGRQIAEVRSPSDGVVLYVVATPPISKDQPVAFIGVPRPGR
jgi:predicted deacylase